MKWFLRSLIGINTGVKHNSVVDLPAILCVPTIAYRIAKNCQKLL